MGSFSLGILLDTSVLENFASSLLWIMEVKKETNNNKKSCITEKNDMLWKKGRGSDVCVKVQVRWAVVVSEDRPFLLPELWWWSDITQSYTMGNIDSAAQSVRHRRYSVFSRIVIVVNSISIFYFNFESVSIFCQKRYWSKCFELQIFLEFGQFDNFHAIMTQFSKIKRYFSVFSCHVKLFPNSCAWNLSS